MKKLGLCIMISLIMCTVVGCGNGEERIKTAEEIAIEQKEKAEDAVDAVNEQTKQLEESASQIEE